MELILLAVPLIVFGLVLAQMAKAQRARRLQTSDSWEAFGEAHGLTLTGEIYGLPVLEGTVDGFTVKLHRNLRSHGKSKAGYTVFKVSLNQPLPPGMKVTRPVLGGGLLTAMGAQDIPLTDKKLDHALRVQGSHPKAVQDLLDIWTVQEALRPVFRSGDQSCIKRDAVVLDRQGTLTGRKLEAAFADTLALAKALTEGPDLAWKDLATRHGLALTRTGTAVRLAGAHAAGAVAVDSPGGTQTRVCFTVEGLHPSVRITAGSGGFAGEDPVLGGRVCIAGSEEALQARFGGLQLDGLRGDLLQVFETWPDALVEDSTLHLTVGGQPYRTIDTLLGELGALATVLRPEDAGLEG